MFWSTLLIKVLISMSIADSTAIEIESPQQNEVSRSDPNVIIILVDDMGYGDVGFNGCLDIPTPNIDRIAQQGVVFTNGYVTWGACGPSRAGLITGRYQGRFGFSRNPLFAPKDPNQGLPLSEETLASALKRADYRTAAIGKWHLGAHPALRPLKRGFDHFFGFLTGGHRYFPEEWTLEDEYAVTAQFEAYKTKLLRDDLRIEEGEYLTDALSREAVNYINKFKDDPFFVYLAYNAPHGPLQATEKYLKRFAHIQEQKRRVYAAMVSAVDDGVGLILDQLNVLNLTENTMVIFLSDNGGPENRNGSDNGPLRGQKGSIFEGGIRVPFAIQWPEQIEPGMVYDNPIISLDLFATILEQTTARVQPKKKLDGVNLMPYLKGDEAGPPHDQLFWRIYDKQHLAVRSGDDKLIVTADSSAVYDLHRDIQESINLSNPDSKRNIQLNNELNHWQNQLMEPSFLGLGQNDEYNRLHPERFERKN